MKVRRTKNEEQNSPRVITSIPSFTEHVYWESLKERKIILNEEISDAIVERVVMPIIKFNEEDKDIPKDQRKPIELYISSYGGSCYDGFSLMSAIESSITPVHTICLGYAMSMGLGIFVAGHHRKCYSFSTFMYHEIMSAAEGKAEEINRATQEYKRLQKMYDDFVLAKTNLTSKKLGLIKKKMIDWYIGADEAKALGIVHEIL
jgi:ATP-dependent Clp protease protease subunit